MILLHHLFGPTKCGVILEEQLALTPKFYARKVRAFYCGSMSVFTHLMSVKHRRSRGQLRAAYLNERISQFELDVVYFDRPDAMDVDTYVNLRHDIQQRMEYLLKQGSRYLIA